MPNIEHVFVLMLENRSFDHFFGLSGRPDIPRPSDSGFMPGAADRSIIDPPHEFGDVQTQVKGGAMDGFSATAKLAFEPSGVPVIAELASEFLLFDNWYSSLPGPTWPNRFFVHAASSGGLAASPSALDDFLAVELPSAAFTFENGTVYDRLDAAGKAWRVYHGDVHPQVLAVQGMVAKSFDPNRFRPLYPKPSFGGFAADLNSGAYDVAYTFIEPNYSIQLPSSFVDGDSQHPRGLVSAGEALMKFVYETIRNSSVWASSVLLITWDEHGGFYDHAPPPVATPPGDEATNVQRAGPNSPVFAFDTFGVRVPAILVSPWVAKGGLGSKMFDGKEFDHSSVISSLKEHFGLGPPLTQRDAAAPTWGGALSATLRTGSADGPARLAAGSASMQATTVDGPVATQVQATAQENADPFIEGVALIALDMDHFVSEKKALPPLATAEFRSQVLTKSLRTVATASGADFQLQLLAYIKQVEAKVDAHKAAMHKTP